jgi:hypothetical protein
LTSHVRQRFGRSVASGFLSAVLLAAAGCRSTISEVPVYRDSGVLVSLRSSAQDRGGSPVRYEHPAALSGERVQRILAAVGVEEHAFFAWRDQGALFGEGELLLLAPRLAEGLRRARADQWVYFSIRNTPKSLTFGVVRFSDGIGFVKNGQLNLVFGNIAYVENVDTTPSTVDPRDAKSSDLVRLTAKPPEARGGPPALVSGDRWLGSERQNWLVFDLMAPPAPAPDRPASVTTPVPGAPELSVPQDAAERLRKLRDLKDLGLITADEYEKKRQEILKGL